MDWLINLFTDTNSIAHIALLYSLVIAVGVLLGKIKIGGISLGVTFVLFAGIVAGHFGMTAPAATIHFLQEFGLILFVFCIGLQVGPGFFESFRKGGVPMNLMAVLLVLLDSAYIFPGSEPDCAPPGRIPQCRRACGSAVQPRRFC